MGKLIQTYANSCGLRIGRPFMLEKFFPLTENLYFTIQGSSGQASKCYDYFPEAMDILQPFLKTNGITIIQLGSKEDKPIPGCKHLHGQTTLAQSLHILARSYLHIGNDSWMVHAAGTMGRPLIALYGSTSAEVHGPYFKDPSKTILLSSHRHGNLPSFSNEGGNKMINLIKPEELAESVLRICGLPNKVPQDTFLMGSNYGQNLVEYVPNFFLPPNVLEGQPLTIRMDYAFNENILAQVLSYGRKCNIVTNKQINIDLIKNFLPSIIGIIYEVSDADSPTYIRALKNSGVKVKVITKDAGEESVSALRMKFFDVCPGIEFLGFSNKENFFDAAKAYRNSELDKNTNFSRILYRSTKFILSDGKIFGSKAAWLENKPIASFEQNVQPVIDRPEFWEEFSHFRIFSPPNETLLAPTADAKS